MIEANLTMGHGAGVMEERPFAIPFKKAGDVAVHYLRCMYVRGHVVCLRILPERRA